MTIPILGSGARQFPVAVPPTPAPESAPTADAPTEVIPTPQAAVQPFDVSQFHDAFAQLKQQVTDRRATLTQDVSSLKAEDEQLQASIADWDARANAAEDRRKAIETELHTKLDEFAQLDEATTHLEATEQLLYPAAPPAADATDAQR